MTSDLETTTDDVYETIRELWQEAQPGMSDNDASGFGQAVVSVPDTAIAERTGLDLQAARDFLDNADGVKLTVARDGETRSVTSLIGG
ncbi:hypothetical protein [Nocardioides xinjiangensis]|uniref:hypothetical protein n=1 Tax=Nocardioides xinjiangensis TaxID=2817376 RepID=UPI001B31290D|nr:hypothetical protein [Nocardioides sp. SYSU D00514]